MPLPKSTTPNCPYCKNQLSKFPSKDTYIVEFACQYCPLTYPLTAIEPGKNSCSFNYAPKLSYADAHINFSEIELCLYTYQNTADGNNHQGIRILSPKGIVLHLIDQWIDIFNTPIEELKNKVKLWALLS